MVSVAMYTGETLHPRSGRGPIARVLPYPESELPAALILSTRPNYQGREGSPKPEFDYKQGVVEP